METKPAESDSAATTGYPRGSLASALNARREQSIGQVLVAWGSYKVGDFVFVKRTGSTWVVSMPMTPGQIADQESRGSLLRDWLTVVSVPAGFVRVVLPHG